VNRYFGFPGRDGLPRWSTIAGVAEKRQGRLDSRAADMDRNSLDKGLKKRLLFAQLHLPLERN